MTISILKMNDKYIVRFEAGMMEQLFKFDAESTGSIENLKHLVNGEFIEATRRRFNDMFMQLKATGTV